VIERGAAGRLGSPVCFVTRLRFTRTPTQDRVARVLSPVGLIPLGISQCIAELQMLLPSSRAIARRSDDLR